jgi:hypothetical protein
VASAREDPVAACVLGAAIPRVGMHASNNADARAMTREDVGMAKR